MALPGGPWDLQEAITEQRTATRTATTPLTLHLTKNPAASVVSQSSSQRSLRQKARLSKKPTSASSTSTQSTSHSLRIVQGEDVIKTIDITKLLAGDHEIRLVPPTRATILYSDPDQPSPLDGSGALSRLNTQVDSQGESQAGSQNKRNCFLRLCFHSLGDLKAASQAFLRLGLRCKTQFKTQNRSLSRTPSLPPISAPLQSGPPPPPSRSPYTEYGAPNPTPSQHHSPYSPAATLSSLGDIPYHAGSYSPCPPAQKLPESTRFDSSYNASVASNVSKRAYTELAEDHDEVRKRRRSVAMQDGAVPGQARRESSLVDPAVSLWPNPITENGGRPSSRSQTTSPGISRLGSVSRNILHDPRAEQGNSRVARTPENPPPRRELPLSIQRHISRTPSHIDGGDENRIQSRLECQALDAPRDSTPATQSKVSEMEVQTEEQFVEPEVAFFAGMELLQDLSTLKDQMLKECMDATRRLGEGGFVEEEARLIAYYAIEFRARFLETCSQKAELFLKATSVGAGGTGT